MIRSKIAMVSVWALLALVLHLVPGALKPTSAQSSRKDDIVFNSRGIPLAGASVRVCVMPASGQPCAPLAQIYSDAALTQALANPTPTDGLGNYYFYAAPGKYMIEVSGPGISTKQIPNVILPNDPTAPTFSTVSSTGAISAFSLTLTGNLTVNGSTVVVGNLASGTLNLANQSSPPGNASSGTVNLYTKSADKKLYYKDETGTETGPLGSGGGGGNPGGNNGDLQAKNGSVLQASGLNDNGTTVVVNRDQQSAGPNPWFDIRSFGAWLSGLSTTGSITSGTAALTLASAQDFANGQGIVVYGAGAAAAVTTPGTPTVSPTYIANGSTTWNYKVMAEDYKGGLSAASSVGTTTTGQATLGVQTVGTAITTISRAGGVYTLTTGSAHNLQAGTQVYITGSADGQANGAVTVTSTPSSTTFTYVVGQNPPLFDYPATSSGGTVQAKACNLLTYPANTFSGQNTLRYWIYRAQGAGAYSVAGVAIGLDPYFMDCGGTAPNPPPYVPSTPPSAAQAGYLATTISSGGGTTALTLATNAGTSASGATVLHDNSAALLAAMNAAANKNGGTVYIPANPGESGSVTFWPFNASTNMTGVNAANSNFITILIDGHIGLGQPWILRGNVKIEGMTKRNSSFMYPGGADFGSLSGYPLFYAKTVSSLTLRNLFLNCNGAQCTDFFSDTNGFAGGTTGFIAENVDFATGSNGSGTNRNVIIKGGFDYFFRQWTCDPQSSSAVLPAPCMDFTDSSSAVESPSQMAGRMVFTDGYVNAAGIRITDAPNSVSPGAEGYHFRSVLDEANLMPFLRVQNSELTSDISLQDVISADSVAGSATPIIDAIGSSLINGVSIQGGLLGISGVPLYIGPTNQASLLGINAAGNSQNINPGNAPSLLLGAPGAQAQALVLNEPVNITGGRLNYSLAVPASLASCAVSAGGNVPVGTHTYALSAVDFDNQETALGPSISVATTTGNQTVTCNFPAAAGGQKGWDIYRDGARSFPNCPAPQYLVATTVYTDSSSTVCGNSPPLINSAGSSIVSASGLTTYQLRLNGAPLTGTTGSNSLAATGRGSYVQGHLPTFDASGNLVDAGVSPTNVSDFFNRASGNLGSEPNSPWTIEAGTLLASAGGLGGNTSSQNYAVFTGVGFPNDDQSVSATWVKTGTPTVQSNSLVLRGSATALTNYLCSPNNTGSSLTIGKFVAGAFTSLASQNTTINNGDIVSFNVTGASLNCYVNGVPVISASDSSISSGFPGLGAFQVYNANGANVQWKNWMASPGYVSLMRPQTWNATQTFASGVSIGGGLAGQVQTATSTTSSAFQSAGINDCNGGSPVTTTPYLVQADSASSVLDRSTACRLQSGASVVNIPSSTASGMTNHFSMVLIDDGAGTVTVQRNTGSTDTFSIYTGALATTGATSFTLSNGQSATLTQGASGIWEVRLVTIGTVANGTATMTTAAIASGACGSTVTVTAAGVATTDVISWSYNAAPAANPGELVISSWPTAGNVNFQYCNPTAAGVTPNAATLNWKVAR